MVLSTGEVVVGGDGDGGGEKLQMRDATQQ